MKRDRSFNRATLLEALHRIGKAAMDADTHLEIAVYGGSALMLAGNFRFATEDVDIQEIDRPWPRWLEEVTSAIASENGWSEDWINDAVTFHLSPLASKACDHVEFGTFPKESDGRGLSVLVPSAEYMLALKLKAMRTIEPLKGPQEAGDIYHLMRVLKIDTPEDAISLLTKFFPVSGGSADKQRFLLKNLQLSQKAKIVDAPTYPR